MATYKVLQDIEAEDKLIGPLTLRQCIYAAIAVIAGYMSFLAINKGVWLLALPLFPFILIGGFFAFPWSKQQSTEVWALAKIRFFLKPRKRIWDQSGVKELVTITVPKQILRAYSNNLSQGEVHSRLKALADTIDTRGWAVKNIDVNTYARASAQHGQSDRLVDVVSLPREVPAFDAAAELDMLDPVNNPVARNLDSLMNTAASNYREKVVGELNRSVLPAPVVVVLPTTPGMPADGPATQWYSNPAPAAPAQPSSFPISPQQAAMPTAADQAILEDIKTRNNQPGALPLAHLRTIQPVSTTPAAQAPAAAPQTPQPPVTTAPSPATLELASNNDLTIAAIAHEAERRNPEPPDEVTVSLH